IAVHSLTHKVYITEFNNHRVQVLNPDLTYSSSFGTNGSNNGEFNHPRHISTDRDGNVYVADSGNHRIQVFTGDGVYLRQFGKKGVWKGEIISRLVSLLDPTIWCMSVNGKPSYLDILA
ncbi:RING finger protein nhl-1, partial [Geodia barretti]